MATTEIDATRAEAFGGRMVGILNDGFTALFVGLGHRTGLFDTLAELPSATSEEIADAAGLHERYVREWLGGMVVAGIVEHDPEAATYRLPAEHAASLTRAAGPDNLAFFAQLIALSGTVEDDLVECFRRGGGVPYERYGRFQEVQAEESAQLFDTALVDVILPLAPGVSDRLAEGIDALDVGTGKGHLVNVLASAFPASRLAGYDLSEEGIAGARAEAAALGLANTRFEVKDVAAVDEGARYDLVTAFDVVHDLAQPERTLAAIHRALRPGGTFLMVEIQASSHLHENVDHPLGAVLYGASVYHCMTVSLAQGGPGHGTAWGEQRAAEALRDAGFSDVEIKHVDGDVFHTFFVARKE